MLIFRRAVDAASGKVRATYSQQNLNTEKLINWHREAQATPGLSYLLGTEDNYRESKAFIDALLMNPALSPEDIAERAGFINL